MQLDAVYHINISDDSIDNWWFMPEIFKLCDMRKPSPSVFSIAAFWEETFLVNPTKWV